MLFLISFSSLLKSLSSGGGSVIERKLSCACFSCIVLCVRLRIDSMFFCMFLSVRAVSCGDAGLVSIFLPSACG